MPPKRKLQTAAEAEAEDAYGDDDLGPMSDQETFDTLKDQFEVKAMTKRARASQPGIPPHICSGNLTSRMRR